MPLHPRQDRGGLQQRAVVECVEPQPESIERPELGHHRGSSLP